MMTEILTIEGGQKEVLLRRAKYKKNKKNKFACLKIEQKREETR